MKRKPWIVQWKSRTPWCPKGWRTYRRYETKAAAEQAVAQLHKNANHRFENVPDNGPGSIRIVLDRRFAEARIA